MMVVGTELGDKTFFIAALLAMSRPPHLIFLGCWGALAVMTVLSSSLGFLMPALLTPQVTHYLVIGLFLFFGSSAAKTAYEQYSKGEGVGASEELEETEKELEDDKTIKVSSPVKLVNSIFTMTFLAEWGDKSQVATIAMGAARDFLGVTLGAIFGHACCTGLAIFGGKMLSAHISERQVNLGSGVLFLGFALSAVLNGPED
eukprot:CAMPEP_0179085748 /NCGR_PEP_ID=MMETSP0796-20121207/38852_1 /TAXON_ID=73915 /ORGANISM="Pyrodinium bahamense, Strain pbaha01" /LENGTH=201 /DNA_ID=CAMNT_0020783193 /DNA_START=41 /DNA_END=646 /DNA_ORIENTATION=-